MNLFSNTWLWFRALLLGGIFLAWLGTIGCGVKGDPVPYVSLEAAKPAPTPPANPGEQKK